MARGLQTPGVGVRGMSQDIQSSKQQMLKAQEALLTYAHRTERDVVRHKQLIQELQRATKDFVDSLERLGQNPPSRLVGD